MQAYIQYMATDFSWIYLLIFLIIPLTRIIPRIIAKRRMQNNSSQTIQERQFQSSFKPYSKPAQSQPEKPQTKEMLVVRELNIGSRTFEKIKKNTGLEAKELDSILSDLENNGMLKVLQKQGILGPKIELYLTDKGFKEYFS